MVLDAAALHRLKTVLQIAIPAVVAADTVYSFWRVHLLWQARLRVRAGEPTPALSCHPELVWHGWHA